MEANVSDVTQSKSVWERVKNFGLRLLDHMHVGEMVQ
jgi:hypothetical protein